GEPVNLHGLLERSNGGRADAVLRGHGGGVWWTPLPIRPAEGRYGPRVRSPHLARGGRGRDRAEVCAPDRCDVRATGKAVVPGRRTIRCSRPGPPSCFP